ncbi:hypothetical protein HOY80DRAFT_1056007 [Tuber brumale]|nr:hypothetical protein HOY80DRAFT_1056007 [Tuber brumale]
MAEPRFQSERTNMAIAPPRGGTPLSWAAEGGYDAVVKKLLAHKDIYPNIQELDGNKPLS